MNPIPNASLRRAIPGLVERSSYAYDSRDPADCDRAKEAIVAFCQAHDHRTISVGAAYERRGGRPNTHVRMAGFATAEDLKRFARPRPRTPLFAHYPAAGPPTDHAPHAPEPRTP